MDKLGINSFNEVVHLHMIPQNQDFYSNNKILESMGSQIISAKETVMRYDSNFWNSCEELLEKIEGDIFPGMIGYKKLDQGKNVVRNLVIRNRVQYLILISSFNNIIFPNLVFENIFSELCL